MSNRVDLSKLELGGRAGHSDWFCFRVWFLTDQRPAFTRCS